MKTYKIIKSNTYALGVEELRKLGQNPPTFEETIQARVDSYNQGDKNLFNTWQDTCTGIAYEKGTTKFKLISKCQELIDIDNDFKDCFLPINYSKIIGKEFDSQDKDIAKQVWLFLLGGKLYNQYEEIIKKENKIFPIFWYCRNTRTDELRALFVINLNYNSNAGGDSNLDYDGSFLRVAQSSQKIFPKTIN